MSDVETLVRASGGIVIRRSGEGAEVLVVHRPRYDDWTFPKGKDDPGETPEIAGLREVWEETGFTCRIVGPGGVTSYTVAAGPKRVIYFLMRPERYDGFRPGDEVDEVRWLPFDQARSLLSYGRDLGLVPELGALDTTSTLHLVRHGPAGERHDWNGADHLRPLTKKGHRQARALAERLVDVGIERVLSSPYLRCTQTVEPIAGQLGLPVEAHDGLAEGAGADARNGMLKEIAGTTAVLCSHGDVIPALVRDLSRRGLELNSRFEAKKGSVWSVAHDHGRFTRASYTPPPPS